MFFRRLVILLVAVVCVQLFLPAIIVHSTGLGEFELLNRALATTLTAVGFTSSHYFIKHTGVRLLRNALYSYVYAAIGMGGVYYLIYASNGGCFSFVATGDAAMSVLDFVYFSFVTVTTLGYGDIVPNHLLVRLLVVVQLLFGAYLILHATQKDHCSGS